MALAAEVKNRRVIRAVVDYGVVAFALLQVIEPIMHGLHLPEATLTWALAAMAVAYESGLFLARQASIGNGRHQVSRRDLSCVAATRLRPVVSTFDVKHGFGPEASGLASRSAVTPG